MKRVGTTVLKNAGFNIVRGCATAAVALLLPHYLTRRLDVDRFSAWALMLQIAAYAGYLDFGLQTAVGRFVAQAIELEDTERVGNVIATAGAMLTIAACLAVVIMASIIANVRYLFHGVPLTLVHEFSGAAAIISFSACTTLALSVYTGVLIGLHRNELVAGAIGGSRLLGAILAVQMSLYTHSLVVLAACVAVPNILGGALQWHMVRRLLPRISTGVGDLSRVVAKDLFRYCTSLSAYSVGMWLVSGVDVTILGYFRFSDVGFYSIAAVLITFLAGLNSAVMSALIAPIAALHARGEVGPIRDIVMRLTKLNVFTNALIIALLGVWGESLLHVWVGPLYASAAAHIVNILAVAQAIRLTGAAYVAMLIATGQQSKGIQNVIAEAFTNLLASIVGGALWGGPGIAYGTLVGAIVGALWIVLFTMRDATEIRVGVGVFLKSGVILPLLCAVPTLLLLCSAVGPPRAQIAVALLGGIASLAMAYRLEVIPRAARRQVVT